MILAVGKEWFLNASAAMLITYLSWYLLMKLVQLANPPAKKKIVEYYGEWAIVTGASSGIGRGIAWELAVMCGMKVIAVGRRDERLEELREDVEKQIKDLNMNKSGEIIVIAADISKESGIDAVLNEATTRAPNGSIGLLVNNAGVHSVSLFNETDADVLNTEIEVNMAAPVRLTRKLLPAIVGSKRGAIINIGGSSSHLPGPFSAVSTASKAFISSFSRSLRTELKEVLCLKNVDVMLVEPSNVDTELHTVAGYPEGFMKTANKNMWSVEDVVQAIMWPLACVSANHVETLPSVVRMGWFSGLTSWFGNICPGIMESIVVKRALELRKLAGISE